MHFFFTFFTVVEFSRYVTSQDFFFCASTPLTSKPEGQPLKLHEERERKEDDCTKREEQARLRDTDDQTYLLSRAFTESVS